MNEDHSTNERRLRDIIDTTPECLMILAGDGSIQKINPAGLSLLEANSLDQATGRSLYSFVVPEYRAAVHLYMDEILEGKSAVLECELTGLRETRRWVEMHSTMLKEGRDAPPAVLSICRDITEHKKLEAQRRHAQKMEAISTLSGGIAHDFNNILTAIIGYSNILKLKLKLDDPIQIFVDQILSSAERATGLTQSLLAFSRKTALSLRPIKLNETVTRAETIIPQLIGENIELKTDLVKTDTTVMADPGQIEQILVNLAMNARDAMPDGGSLLLSTEIKVMNNEFIRTYGYGKPGVYAVINVADTGRGMDKKTRERVFEPFFTTKGIGKGTGLGLANAYGIVKQHHGFINCSSEPDKGTVFSIYLPLANPSAPVLKSNDSVVPQGGTETILVAEDDQEVRKLAVNFLQNFGYTIVESENGEEAVQLFQQHKDKIRLLLFDVVMPKKNGKEAYDEIRRLSPRIKILFMSGYNTGTMVNKSILGEGLDFVLKPTSPEVLLKKVREVLDK
ncbi:MAG TPA: ATP-binding protein [Nitrospirota bacterium]|nr:ATP-binding protein [Nitrospirota bacterium]